MAMPRKDVMGKTFGKLTVIGEGPTKGGARQAIAMCSCGNTATVRVGNLLKGSTTSCGCYWLSKVQTHGDSQGPLYKVWAAMWDRCSNTNHLAYSRYGGKGIVPIDFWKDVKVFIEWANANGYAPDLTLDRRDNLLGYSPDNCRWVTRTTQQRNRGAIKGGSSVYIGVGFFKLTKKWKANIKVNGKLIHLGYYFTELQAAKVRDQYIVDNKLTDFTMNNVL